MDPLPTGPDIAADRLAQWAWGWWCGTGGRCEVQPHVSDATTSGTTKLQGRGFRLVGAPRFELGTPCTPCKCATRLRHAPTGRRLYGI